MRGWRTDKQYLSLEDLVSIYGALRGMQSATGDAGMQELLERIGALMTDQPYLRDASGPLLDFTPASGETDRLRSLHLAIKDLRHVELEYMDANGEETKRMIEPMGLYWRRNAWYVWGYCRFRSALRVFRLSRIDRVRDMNESFVRRALSIEDVDADRNLASPPICALLRFRPAAKAKVRDEFQPDRVEVQADGTMQVTAYYYTKENAIRHIMSYGKDVALVGPPGLVGDLQGHIADLAKLYHLRL